MAFSLGRPHHHGRSQCEEEAIALSEARKRENMRHTKSNVKQVGLKFYPAGEDRRAWLKV